APKSRKIGVKTHAMRNAAGAQRTCTAIQTANQQEPTTSASSTTGPMNDIGNALCGEALRCGDTVHFPRTRFKAVGLRERQAQSRARFNADRFVDLSCAVRPGVTKNRPGAALSAA